MADADSTVVSVVYELEYPLLLLQARSMARYLREGQFREIIVIDNSTKGMPLIVQRQLMAQYGPLAPSVTVLRAHEISQSPRAVGWSSQQQLKLAVATRVKTRTFVLLDAKNHFIAPLPPDFFEGPDGRLKASWHSYAKHPLRRNLERVLRYLQLDPSRYVPWFTATVTPFALRTEIVTSMMTDIERRSRRTFAEEFVKNDLTEFFLYAGWIISQGRDIEDVYDLNQLPTCPIVWPKSADECGVAAAIATAEDHDLPIFAVHRRALVNLPDEAVRMLADFWAGRELFPSAEEAESFVAEFRAQHESQIRAQTRRDLPGKVLSVPRKVRRELMHRLPRVGG
ncbi:DUF6492 family protein [Kocuria sp. CH-021]|uniref:DUF6492 family protein n=1 Tax=Kocuria sp. CH-021 TaxID=3406735 RepID=UPI003C75A7DC